MTAKKVVLRPGDPVRARGCDGIARIERFSKKDGVYFLDRQLSRQFYNRDLGAYTGVPFWTFEKCDLTKIDLGEG